MNITDHLSAATETLDPAGPDLDRLTRVARVQGTRARRRRHAGAALACVAGVAAVGALGSTLPRSADPEAGFAGEPAAASPVVAVSPRPGPYAPRTARGVLAALRDLTTQQVPGAVDEYAGQGGLARLTPFHEIYVQVTLHPEGDPGASVVGINVEPPEPPGSGEPGCQGSEASACRQTVLADGSLLITSETHDQAVGGVGIHRDATLVAPDGWSVNIDATNGYDGAGGVWTTTRPEPALTLAQLGELASQPLWLGDFPASYDVEGRAITPYDDLNGHRGEF